VAEAMHDRETLWLMTVAIVCACADAALLLSPGTSGQRRAASGQRSALRLT
jgi:hypothetical protein